MKKDISSSLHHSKNKMNVIVRQQDVGVWLTMQAGRMMRCWHQQLRGRFLGFHTSSSWARNMSRTAYRILHVSVASRCSQGPAVHSVLGQSWHCPTPLPLSLCDLPLLLRLFTAVLLQPAQKSSRWWGDRNSPAIYYTWEIRAGFFPFLPSLLFSMLQSLWTFPQFLIDCDFARHAHFASFFLLNITHPSAPRSTSPFLEALTDCPARTSFLSVLYSTTPCELSLSFCVSSLLPSLPSFPLFPISLCFSLSLSHMWFNWDQELTLFTFMTLRTRTVLRP